MGILKFWMIRIQNCCMYILLPMSKFFIYFHDEILRVTEMTSHDKNNYFVTSFLLWLPVLLRKFGEFSAEWIGTGYLYKYQHYQLKLYTKEKDRNIMKALST